MTHLLSWNGELVPADQCRISPDNENFLVGTGVFETLVTVGGKPFAFAEHYERLAGGAEVLGISLPGPDELGEELVALLEAVKAQEDRHRIRITLSSEGRLLTANPCEAAPESITAVTDPHPVNERGRLAHVKSTSYGEYRLALEAAQAAGAQEAILVNVSGDLCEGATSNVFFARDGVLHTPSLECGCLPGVTRKLLLAALRKSGVEVREGRNPMTVLESCDEVLVTSTLKNVCPVSNLDERQLDTSGPFAQLARESFDAVFGC